MCTAGVSDPGLQRRVGGGGWSASGGKGEEGREWEGGPAPRPPPLIPPGGGPELGPCPPPHPGESQLQIEIAAQERTKREGRKGEKSIFLIKAQSYSH